MFGGNFVQRVSANRFEERRNDDDIVFGFFRSTGTRDFFDYKATLRQDTNALGGERHTVTVAADYQREFLTINSASFVFSPPSAAFWANGARRTRKGLSGEYGVELPWDLNLTGAARHDWNSGFDNVTTWRVTAAKRVAESGTRLHASIGTGVTNPTFTEQYGFFTATFIGNPALRPERSLGWDAGIEQSWWNGRVVTDVTYFESGFRDKIAIVAAGGGILTTPVNLPGISERQGVEVSAKYSPVHWLALGATYTYTDSRLPDGSPEIRRPKHAASGSATILFADGRGRATLNVIYNGRMADTWFRFPLTPVTLKAYTLVGGIVSYDVTRWATAYVRVENLLSARYEEIFSYRAPGFAIYAGLKLRAMP
jgi:vitamin B12 transporter